jgi:hypothetical protein
MSVEIAIVQMPAASAHDTLAVAAEWSAGRRSRDTPHTIIGVWPDGDVRVNKQHAEPQLEVIDRRRP